MRVFLLLSLFIFYFLIPASRTLWNLYTGGSAEPACGKVKMAYLNASTCGVTTELFGLSYFHFPPLSFLYSFLDHTKKSERL